MTTPNAPILDRPTLMAVGGAPFGAGGGTSSAVYVTLGNRGQWLYDASSTLTPNALDVLDAAPLPGRYLRNGPVLGWNDRTDVFVATATTASPGSDSATGTDSAHPLLTMSEALLRLGSQPSSNHTIHLAGDAIEDLDVVVRPVDGGSITIVGTRTPQLEPGVTSYTLTVVTPWNGATRTQGTYQLTRVGGGGGHPNLTALGWANATTFVEVSGSTNVLAVIGKDLGNGTFSATFGDTNSFTSVEPANGATVIVYKVNRLGGFVATETANSTGGSLDIVDLNVGSTVSSVVNSAFAQFIGCLVNFADDNLPNNEVDFVCCGFTGGGRLAVFGVAIMVSCCLVVNLLVDADGKLFVQGNVIVQGAQLVVGDTTFGQAQLVLSQAASISISDAPLGGPAFYLLSGKAYLTGFVFVTNALGTAAVGIQVDRSERMLLTLAAHLPFNVTAATADWLVDGIGLTQAQMTSLATNGGTTLLETSGSAGVQVVGAVAASPGGSLGQYSKQVADGAANTATAETVPPVAFVPGGHLGPATLIQRLQLVSDVQLHNWGGAAAIVFSDADFVSFIVRFYDASANLQKTLTVTTRLTGAGSMGAALGVGSLGQFNTVSFRTVLAGTNFPFLWGGGMTVEITKGGAGKITGFLAIVAV